MKFTLESGTGANTIRAYSSERIEVGEQSVVTSCIVTADVLITDWEATRSAELTPAHLERLFALEPEIVLLGTGATQQFPARDVRNAFVAHNVALEVMDLGAACRTYNVLVSEGRRVAAALFLT